jgi:hypothetical protein
MEIPPLFADRVEFTLSMHISSKIKLKQSERSFQRMGEAVSMLALIGMIIFG